MCILFIVGKETRKMDDKTMFFHCDYKRMEHFEIGRLSAFAEAKYHRRTYAKQTMRLVRLREHTAQHGSLGPMAKEDPHTRGLVAS
jgi:hypothetical protein